MPINVPQHIASLVPSLETLRASVEKIDADIASRVAGIGALEQRIGHLADISTATAGKGAVAAAQDIGRRLEERVALGEKLKVERVHLNTLQELRVEVDREIRATIAAQLRPKFEAAHAALDADVAEVESKLAAALAKLRPALLALHDKAHGPGGVGELCSWVAGFSDSPLGGNVGAWFRDGLLRAGEAVIDDVRRELEARR